MSSTPSSTAPADSQHETGRAAEVDVATLLGALEDDDCRAILEATSEQALSTSELCEQCDLSTSSAYRKVDELTEVGLLEESVRLRPAKAHTSEYRLAVSKLEISLDGGQLELSVTSRQGNPPSILAD
ncbi:MAG: helix-turn-helix domain-containing protein [Halovenus sp.]|uniref:helix-turn-helix domain-containing protein n=1 Tax=Halovenus amylolytica TaxID=2500550 RepID=UPI000FE371A7